MSRFSIHDTSQIPTKKHVILRRLHFWTYQINRFFIADINVIANDDKDANNCRKNGTEYVYFAWIFLFWRVLCID